MHPGHTLLIILWIIVGLLIIDVMWGVGPIIEIFTSEVHD